MEEVDIDHTMVCDACQKNRALEDFRDIQVPDDPMDPGPLICNTCTSGLVPRNHMLKLTNLQSKILQKFVAERKSVRRISRELGCSEGYVSQLINGRGDQNEFRKAVRLVLEEAGVDIYAIARGLSESLQAEKFQWNAQTQDFSAFPDNPARGSAQDRAAKLLALYQPPMSERHSDAPTVAVQIITNVGTDAPHEASPGVYVVEQIVEPSEEKDLG